MKRHEDTDRTAPHEKRSEPREPARDPARLHIARLGYVEAVVVDRSLKGMRLRLPPGVQVALSLTAFDLNRFTIHDVKVMWKAYPDIGVQVQSSFDVRTGQGPQAAAMRRFWVDATARS